MAQRALSVAYGMVRKPLRGFLLRVKVTKTGRVIALAAIKLRFL
jgi:membrane protein YqaA with SNARE-associated domain